MHLNIHRSIEIIIIMDTSLSFYQILLGPNSACCSQSLASQTGHSGILLIRTPHYSSIKSYWVPTVPYWVPTVPSYFPSQGLASQTGHTGFVAILDTSLALSSFLLWEMLFLIVDHSNCTVNCKLGPISSASQLCEQKMDQANRKLLESLGIWHKIRYN